MKKINKIQKEIEKEIGRKINFKSDFKKNNLDSLDVITLITLIEKKFDITINEKQILKLKNFSDIEKLL